MNILRDSPIRQKMMAIMLIASAIALLIAGAVLFFFQSRTLREDIARDLSTLAEVIAVQSTAAVTFRDQHAADEILMSLKVKEQIVSARIETGNGDLLASYGPKTGQRQSRQKDHGVQFEDRYILLKQPIILDGSQIGALHLQADFQTTYQKLLSFYGRTLTLVMTASLLLITLLSAIFQRIITEPIQKLAATAASIAEHKDYSLRAEKFGEDEIGRLAEAFNLMLAQIQTQNAELGESRERFEVAVSGSRDGLWDWDLSTNKVYFSLRWKKMLGYEEHEVAPCYEEFARLLHPEDKERVLDYVRDYLAGSKPNFEIEFRMLQKDGDYCWILSRGVALRNAAGKPYRMAGSYSGPRFQDSSLSCSLS
jgi:PAS domain S-box-containing protein